MWTDSRAVSYSDLVAKVPSPFPSSTETVFEPSLATARSGTPSASRSAITTAYGSSPASNERNGAASKGSADGARGVSASSPRRNAGGRNGWRSLVRAQVDHARALASGCEWRCMIRLPAQCPSHLRHQVLDRREWLEIALVSVPRDSQRRVGESEAPLVEKPRGDDEESDASREQRDASAGRQREEPRSRHADRPARHAIGPPGGRSRED